MNLYSKEQIFIWSLISVQQQKYFSWPWKVTCMLYVYLLHHNYIWSADFRKLGHACGMKLKMTYLKGVDLSYLEDENPRNSIWI